MRLEGTHASSHSVGIYRSGIKIRRLFGATEATISVTALASHSRSLQLISRLIVPHFIVNSASRTPLWFAM